MKDPVIRNAEIDFFISSVAAAIKVHGQELSLFDIGCGNGHLLSVLREHYPHIKLHGLEFHPDLFQLANSLNLNQCQMIQGDMREKLDMFGQHHVVITERSVINLLDKDEQFIALKNIAESIVPGGFYFMSESFEGPRQNINRARKEMALPPDVMPSKHNLWLTENDIEAFKNFGFTEISEERCMNHLSTHFYISRVLHPCIL